MMLSFSIERLVSDEQKCSFCRDQAESLGVSSEVIKTIMKIEEKKALRRRVDLLNELDESKERIYKALETGLDKVTIFWFYFFIARNRGSEYQFFCSDCVQKSTQVLLFKAHVDHIVMPAGKIILHRFPCLENKATRKDIVSVRKPQNSRQV